MKTLTFIIMLSFLSSIAFGQFMYSDFDDQQNFQFFGWPNEPEIVSNPDPSGVNTSVYVGRVERGFYEFAHVYCDTEGRILVEDNPIFTMKVWSPISCEILFKLENSANLEIAIEVSSYITTPNQWEELTFDFSGQTVDIYDKVVIFFDFNTTNNYTFYFDDIEGAEIEGFGFSAVTFNVDMTEANNFNPETDEVYIAGNFADWQEPGSNPDLAFSPIATNSLIYTLTFDSIPTGVIEYKYFIVYDNIPSWEYGEWMGDPNRFVYISDNMTLDDIWSVIVPPEVEMIADFENINLLNIIEVMGCGNWNNLPISETFMPVINPNPSGINSSSTVLKFLRRGTNELGEAAAGFVANHTLNVDEYDFLHVMVWKPKISPLKVRTHWYSSYYETLNLNQQNAENSWVDIVFDLRTFENEYGYFDLFPDFEEPLSSNELVEIYIDNIRLSNDSTPMLGVASNFTADATDICEAGNIAFAPDTANAYIDSVLWSFPGGNPSSSTEIFPVVQYNTAGIYDVTLTAYWNNLTNTIEKSAFIHVAPNPEIPATPSGENILCFDEYSSSYTTNSENVIWELGPASAGTTNFYDSTCIIIWNENFADEATLKAKSFNVCGESEFSEVLTIEKLDAIVPDFSATPTQFISKPYEVKFSNLTPNSELYDFVWYFGNGDSSLMVQPEYTYSEGGTYTVSLVATGKTTGCTGTFLLENYIFCSGTGIGDKDEAGFKYFVDRNKNSLELIFDQQPENLHFSLFDILGFELRSSNLFQKSTSISLNGLSDGMYVFVIDGKITGKVMLLK